MDLVHIAEWVIDFSIWYWKCLFWLRASSKSAVLLVRKTIFVYYLSKFHITSVRQEMLFLVSWTWVSLNGDFFLSFFRELRAKFVFSCSHHNPDLRGLQPILGLEFTSEKRLILLLILQKLFLWAKWCNFCSFSLCVHLIHICDQKRRRKNEAFPLQLMDTYMGSVTWENLMKCIIESELPSGNNRCMNLDSK